LLLTSAGLGFLVAGAAIQTLLRLHERPENNFVTLQFYMDHPGVTLMLLGAVTIALGIWK
jgi:hypothetical protein